MIEYVWLIPAIMLVAALVNGLGVRALGALAGHIAWLSMAACCVISFLVLNDVIGKAHADSHWHGDTIVLWNWFDIHNAFGPNRHFNIDMAFHVDQLTAVFLCFVSLIGTLVFVYATGYMRHSHGGHTELDPGYARFFCYVSLFAASMFILVLGANLTVMFIGWEGVGLCSYLLIGYFFDKPFTESLSCASAGRKAFVMNRIGDAGLIVGMGLFFWGLGTVDFEQMNAILKAGVLGDGTTPIPAGFQYGGALVTIAMLAMFLGATGKSAQIPLFTWLPDAMAGPTPVSALIHAATMVTAGVYMIARMNVPFFLAPDAMAVVAIIGAGTAFAAATMGLTQRGIKKILAYSTVSQLGFMFLGLGVGAMAGGIFHVFTHAFFKACLFLAAGSIIHALHHEEDVFKMGGLKKYMPWTFLAFLCGTVAIAGVPPFSGFFSKDEILFSAYMSVGEGETPYLWYVGVITAIMTSIYMGRALFLAFFGDFRYVADHGHGDGHGHDGHDEHGHDDHGHDKKDDHGHGHAHRDHGAPVKESSFAMTGPILVLGVLGLVVGFLNVPKGLSFAAIPGVGVATFHHFLAPVVDEGAEHVALLQNPAIKIDHAAGKGIDGPRLLAGDMANEFRYTAEHKKTEFNLAVQSGILAIVGLGIAAFFFAGGLTRQAKAVRSVLAPLHAISFNRWWWDDAYNLFFRDGTWRLSIGVWKADMSLVDGAVNGAGALSQATGRLFRRFQTGQVQNYGFVMVLGLCLMLGYFTYFMADFLNQSMTREDAKPIVKREAIRFPAPADAPEATAPSADGQ